jgi:hypothetical protein
MRRVVLRWVAASVVLLLAGVGSVAVIVSVGFGPSSVVTAYLDALARRDAASALALPGVVVDGGSRALLTSAALPGLSGVRVVDDVEHDGGMHRITASWTSDGEPGQTTFEVERVGTLLGVFPVWGFAQSPIARLSLDVRDALEVTAGTQAVHIASTGAHDYAVLVPGSYRFSEDTALRTADPVTVPIDTVGQRVAGTVHVGASAKLVAAVQTQVHALLAACAKQTVLFPAGCPFGQEIDDRVVSTPAWSIRSEPEIRLEGSGDGANWTIPSVPGTAHLVVQVQSLFDGATTTFDKDVPFTIRATVRVGADGSISITAVS